ncbi:MAG: hypothetical protein M3494_03305 [Actinomycetota bacterium]|jgi:hypothetical protein|nr:hypothetical protein [Rubrobacter sp.]MDQ3507031.1 hypothetical protein [Actinomycetota bacterium]
MAQSTERVQFRLDWEHREKLRTIAEARGVSLSEWLRGEIDRSYEEELSEERKRAVAEISAMNLEDMPDMKTLKRQIEGAYDGPDLY